MFVSLVMNDETIVVIFFISIANERVERLFTSWKSIDNLLATAEALFLGRSSQVMGIFNIFLYA